MRGKKVRVIHIVVLFLSCVALVRVGEVENWGNCKEVSQEVNILLGWDFAVARAGNRIKVCLYNFCFLFAFDGYCPDLPLFVLQRKRMDCKSGKLAKTRGGDNPIDNGKSQNLHPSTPKPDSMHKYKTFCLKDHILLRKKRPCPGNITFWPSQAPPQWQNWPKIDVRVIIWEILMHVQFLYNF